MPTRPLIALLILITTCALAAGFAVPGPDAMSVAAQQLLDSLTDEQRERITYPFDDAERRNWQATPRGTAGVRLDAMTSEQQARVQGLLKSALSDKGVETVAGVRMIEGILVEMERRRRGRASSSHGPGRYFITIYGDPSGDPPTPWGWRMEGHHLSMTFTCGTGSGRDNVGGWIAHGPVFIGSQPAHVHGGEHDGFRLLGAKDDNVRALLHSLGDELREQATGAEDSGRLPGNVILLPGRDDGFVPPRSAQGLAGKDMTAEQKDALLSAMFEWAELLRDDLAEAEKERMRAGIDETRFLWMGDETDIDAPHYWRIVGQHFAIEYAAPERDPDHVHALWRDLENDFGGNALRRHLEEEHGIRSP